MTPPPTRLRGVCSTAKTESPLYSPDGGEELSKRKGVVARRGMKEAWSKALAHEQEPDREAYDVGELADNRRSPYPSDVSSKSGGCASKAVELTRVLISKFAEVVGFH